MPNATADGYQQSREDEKGATDMAAPRLVFDLGPDPDRRSTGTRCFALQAQAAGEIDIERDGRVLRRCRAFHADADSAVDSPVSYTHLTLPTNREV